MPLPRLRLHRFLPASHANGPGLRAVIWVQGCTLACPGCFNPATHAPAGGTEITVPALFAQIQALAPTVEGLSLSGGEPLQQAASLLALLQRVRAETTLSVLLFTGYTWDEIQTRPDAAELLACVDVLIAGRYVATARIAHTLLGSANQTLHLLTNRYSLADLHAVPPAEVIITANGTMLMSGIDPLRWRITEKEE